MKSSSNRRAFTLVEVLVSSGLLTMVLFVLISIVNQTSKTWSYTHSKIDEFREARNAFEEITRRLSQATLNTYLDFEDQQSKPRTAENSSSFIPYRYARQSELRFISGPNVAGNTTSNPPRPTHSVFFQAPLGFANNTTSYGELESLLNTCGYYIQYSDDSANIPPFLSGKIASRHRFRMMELIEPAESLRLYKYTAAPGYKGHEWFTDALDSANPPVHVLAENVIALILLPRLSSNETTSTASGSTALAPGYSYDTTESKSDPEINPKHQLPPIVQLTMVVIDETSARRLSDSDNQQILEKAGSLFTDASNYASDLTVAANPASSLEALLVSKRLNYRVFTSNISIKGARWSREQKN